MCASLAWTSEFVSATHTYACPCEYVSREVYTAITIGAGAESYVDTFVSIDQEPFYRIAFSASDANKYRGGYSVRSTNAAVHAAQTPQSVTYLRTVPRLQRADQQARSRPVSARCRCE